MTARNGKPVESVEKLTAKPGGGMPAKSVEWLERRTAAFQEMTSGAGKPMSYGHGKAPSQADKPAGRK